MIAKIQAQITE